MTEPRPSTFTAGAIAAALAAVMLPIALTAPAAQAQQLRLATVVTAPHPWIDTAEAFKSKVEADTAGRVKVAIFPGGQLGNDQTVIDEIRIGTIDMIIGGTQNASPFIRKFDIFSLNYMFSGMDGFRRTADSEGPVFKHFDQLVSQAGVGLKLLAFTGGGTRNLSTNVRAVTSPDDIKGIKMRVPGSKMDARMWQAVGALTTSLPWTEIYTGVQTGVVGAFESTISGYFGSKLYEVAPYHAKTEHQIMMSHISMSEVTFKRLSAADRAIVLAAARDASKVGIDKGVEYDGKLLDALQSKHGVKVSEVDKAAFMKATAPLHEEIAQQLGAADLLQMIRSLQ